MANCVNCGSFIPDGVSICPYCAALQNQNYYNPAAAAPQANYGFDAYAQSQYYTASKDVSTAKALGIVAIVCSVVSSFVLAGLICGIIGMHKANSVMTYAQQSANMGLYNDAKSAKTLNLIGLIISIAVMVIALFAFIFMMFFMYEMY